MNEKVKQQKREQEAELLLRLKQGDEKAFTQLFYAYKDKLFGFVLSITHSEEKAEDVVQDVFTKIWQNRNSIGAIENFNAYIFRITQNQAIDYLRQFSKETLAISALTKKQEHLTASTPVDMLLNKEINNQIENAISQLPPQQKKIYILHKEQGFKHEEIAQQLNLSLSTIQNHMGQALGNIRKHLAQVYPGLFSYWPLFLGILSFFYKK